ncbi:MAG: hypothetical protein JSU81_01095 [Candidatus Coatesbacteria bacterium]|nr:MAG: hypothetical protein JSU81_01095 [Candidatus Coatesbacteria bacterium]
MSYSRVFKWALAGALVAGGAVLFCGCEGDDDGVTRPEVQYRDQTFSLLVCDGNGNADTAERATNWDHDGAAVVTLDWNGDGEGPNLLPVTYIYNGECPEVDGVAEKLGAKGGDWYLWETTPWVIIKTSPVVGGGSKITEVWAKALYTYVNTPRLWLFFRWEDPTHTLQPTKDQGLRPVGGIMQYYWLQTPGGGGQGQWDRILESQEDWLALAFSTWFLRNTNNRGKANKDDHRPADLNTSDWVFVETVPGFQERGIATCLGRGETAYKTPDVHTNDADSPYYDKYYPGPYLDLWFASASRTNYCGQGQEGAAWAFDCNVDDGGFAKPPLPSLNNPRSLEEHFTFDGGVVGYEPNGDVAGLPAYVDENFPEYYPPGPPYLWKPTAVPYPGGGLGGIRVPGYLHRPPSGSVADVRCRLTWQQPNREWYEPWEGENGERLKDNGYGKDWHYCLELERELGAAGKVDPTEDVLLGIYEAR